MPMVIGYDGYILGKLGADALDSYAYLKDFLERLPTRPSNRIEELLPHRWEPGQS